MPYAEAAARFWRTATGFDFDAHKAYAIYAPNGAMKSPLAQTSKDLTDALPSKDGIFTTRVSSRKMTDENGTELPKDNILVIFPYIDTFDSSERMSTLLRRCSWMRGCGPNIAIWASRSSQKASDGTCTIHIHVAADIVAEALRPCLEFC